MKKNVLFLLIALITSAGLFAQDQIIADFEDGDTVFAASSGNHMAAIDTNPNPSGINTSDSVLKVTAAGDWYEEMSTIVNFNFYTHPVLSFKVLSMDTISIMCRLDRADAWETYMVNPEFPWNGGFEFKITGDSLGEWVEFQYDLSRWDPLSDYQVLKIMPQDRTFSSDTTFYLDDVKMIERDPVFDNTTIVPIFYDPVTLISWVGGWVGKVAPTDYQYRARKTGWSMLNTDTIMITPNAYEGGNVNDTIPGSSGGAAYILSGTGTVNNSLTFPSIPSPGVGNMQLKFDLSVTGHGYTTGMAPKVEVKFADSTNWEPALTLNNLPDNDSAWTTVTADIAGAGSAISIRFTNELPADADTMEFIIDDITLLGTVTTAESIDPAGKDGLTEATIGGSLQMELNALPAGSSQNANWSSGNTDVATINASGLLTGVAAGTSWISATTIDGSNLTDSVEITVLADSIKVTSITVTADPASIDVLEGTTEIAYTVLPANATDPTCTIAITAGGTLAYIVPGSSTLAALGGADGTVTVTATANDGSGVTGSVDVVLSNQTPSGIIDISQSIYTVYPNPANNLVTINNALTIEKVNLVSLTGSIIQSYVNNGDDMINLNLDGIDSGLYLIQIYAESGIVYNGKLTIE